MTNTRRDTPSNAALPERVLVRIRTMCDDVLDAPLREKAMLELAELAYNEGVIYERMRLLGGSK